MITRRQRRQVDVARTKIVQCFRCLLLMVAGAKCPNCGCNTEEGVNFKVRAQIVPGLSVVFLKDGSRYCDRGLRVSDSFLDRIDIAVFQRLEGAEFRPKCIVFTGIPASVPVPISVSLEMYVPLAEIRVPATCMGITNDLIRDLI